MIHGIIFNYFRRNDLCSQIRLMRDNNHIYKTENEIAKISKEIYDIDLQIEYKSFNPKGIMSLKLIRDIILK
jgi:hypothetical protein